MTHEEILREIVALPPDAQRQVADFVAFLHKRYKTRDAGEAKTKPDIAEEEAIGIWSDREDMKDSTAWVRETRRREWERHQ